MSKLLVVRVKEKGVKGDRSYEYKNSVNISDANMLAVVLQDLIDIFNAPILKAVAILKEEQKIFPFSP